MKRKSAKIVPIREAHPAPFQPPALIEAQTPTLGLPIKGVTRTALHLPDDLDQASWERIGQLLSCLSGVLQWLWGDWLHFGTLRGYITRERYDIGEALSGYERHYLWNLAYVAGKVASSRRREDLPWALHAEVASLEPADQDRLLALASENDWRRGQLRTAVNAAKAQEDDSGAEAANEPEKPGTATADKADVADYESHHQELKEKTDQTKPKSGKTSSLTPG